MKKIIIKSIAFFVILFLILVWLSFIFKPKNNTEEAGMKVNGLTQLLGEEENTIDLIVLGNSEAFTSIIPMKLWEDKGYTSQICGYPGIVLPDTIKSLYDATRTQNPKVVVLESNVIFDDVSIAVPLSRVVQTILPITEYHDRWKNLKLEDFYKKTEYTSKDYLKGFHLKMVCNSADSSNYMVPSDEQQEISEKSKIYLKIMNKYCEMIGAKFVIISVPSTTNWDYKKHNALEAFTKNEGIDFIDFNVLTNELGIDWTKDTIDAGEHMNYYGSVKLTNYFEKYLEEQNLLKSHKGDKKYESWDEDLKKYKEEISK